MIKEKKMNFNGNLTNFFVAHLDWPGETGVCFNSVYNSVYFESPKFNFVG